MASYKFLSNKPKINGIEVLGNKELKDYNLTPIMYDRENNQLYTVLSDGTRVAIIPEGALTQYVIIMTITATRSNTPDIQMAELNFYDTDGNIINLTGSQISVNTPAASSSEAADNLLDRNINTKFCGPWVSPTIITIYTDHLPEISKFSYTTANDAAGRDPVSFTIKRGNPGEFIEDVKTIAVADNAGITTSRRTETQLWNCIHEIPAGYTQIDAIFLNANAVGSVLMSIGGDLEWNATLAWSVNASQQCIGFALAANAYIGITANGEVSAEWSIADRGVPGSDPTAKNTIHAKFVSGQMTELTIDGFATTSYGYPNGFANYNDYSSFGLNIAPGGGVVSVTYWHTDFVKNGETIIDLYPCKRDSDDVLGLYDIIGGVFYPIAGATEV